VFVRAAVCLPACLPAYPSVCLSVCLSVRPSVRPSVRHSAVCVYLTSERTAGAGQLQAVRLQTCSCSRSSKSKSSSLVPPASTEAAAVAVPKPAAAAGAAALLKPAGAVASAESQRWNIAARCALLSDIGGAGLPELPRTSYPVVITSHHHLRFIAVSSPTHRPSYNMYGSSYDMSETVTASSRSGAQLADVSRTSQPNCRRRRRRRRL
jgi:hypothetical protein